MRKKIIKIYSFVMNIIIIIIIIIFVVNYPSTFIVFFARELQVV
jgi:hypothetical protein